MDAIVEDMFERSLTTERRRREAMVIPALAAELDVLRDCLA
jgi:hypothetical protein